VRIPFDVGIEVNNCPLRFMSMYHNMTIRRRTLHIKFEQDINSAE
jgi:hypothetical protein